MKILILGCTGTIGFPLSKKLIEDNHEVYGLCRRAVNTIEGIKYIIGNFNDEPVRERIRKTKWDVIIDFLWHNEKKFELTYAFLSSCTKHYIFLSSAAVYANNKKKLIDEGDIRFYDINNSHEELYHLQKARMENVIFQSDYKNWTIIRPHITFNINHIPLDIWSEKVWIYRFMQGRKVVLTRDMLSYKTSYTFGEEVAELIKLAICNSQSYSQVYNVASKNFYTWEDIVSMLSECIREITGKELCTVVLDSNDKGVDIASCLPHMSDRLIYDRLLDRTINTSKIRALGKVKFNSNLKDDLINCLQFFIEHTDVEKISYDNATEIAYMDWICKEKTPLRYFPKNQRCKYLFFRYFISYKMAVTLFYIARKLRDKLFG